MLISIITINYNNKAGLSNTLNSVISQSFVNFEYIVIDGNSTDGSKEIVEAHKEKLSYWISERDLGIYNAMNKGIRASKGKYLLFLNSGDTLNDSNKLQVVSEYLKTNKDIYYGNLELIHKTYNEVKVYPDQLSFNYFYNKGHIPHPSSFIKRTLFHKVYLYKEKFKIVSDWDFFVCAICKHNATYCHINKVISKYKTDGISADPKYVNVVQNEREQSIIDNFPLFIDESKRLVNYDKKFRLNRFKMLNVLEENSLAQKMNSVWLTLLTKLFRKPYK
ncbi:glycosyltransferase family 2 protein [Winogradskyella sp. PG-2]|uniref:glycosyltransferase family 2 protein n=1 Tax=Winogradskyella sp. PG-2 TaxID=754409 RepID=UPI0004586FCD|nr:glycosyltransferase family 2 protein [Winogradskyella sp. PG-2]BAO74406.1 colanic acid biosynthesis glycosyl transferase WcaE [Winogradskyella sp. PG-2]